MRSERYAPVETDRVIGSATLILAAVGCFTIGFVALMVVPRFWPHYVQAPIAADASAARPLEVGTTAPAPVRAAAPAPGVVTEIKPGTTTVTQKIAVSGSLTALAECKAAIRAGESFEKVGPDQMAAMFGTRGKPLTSAQLDAGCRRLTE